MQRNVISGLVKETSGLSSLRRDCVSSSPKPSGLAVTLSQGRFPDCHAGRYGIPDDVITQTDHTSLDLLRIYGIVHSPVLGADPQRLAMYFLKECVWRAAILARSSPTDNLICAGTIALWKSFS